MTKPQRSAQLIFIQTLLVLLVFVVLFGALAIHGLRLATPGAIWAVSVTVAVLCVLGAGAAGRGKGGRIASIVLGTLAHAVIVAVLLLSGMWFGAVLLVAIAFLAMWFVALFMGARIDRERAERVLAAHEQTERAQAGRRQADH